MRRDDRVRLLHMIEAAETAATFLVGHRRADLDTDRLLLFGVVRAIELMGEAASKVSLETRAFAPEIPWAAVTGMRNRLIHGYFDLDHTVVWNTATVELPQLLGKLRRLLEER